MIEILPADYQNTQHCSAITELIDMYAQDDMGQNKALRPEIRAALLDALMHRPWIHIFLACRDLEMIGIAVCIEGFSTFNSAPLMNIHDVYVKPVFRRQGVAHKMFHFIENAARKAGFCKLTLEVLEGNIPAQAAYRKIGFAPYTANDHGGSAQFWQKYLS